MDTGADEEVILNFFVVCIAVMGSEALLPELAIVRAEEWARVGGDSVGLPLMYLILLVSKQAT